MKSWKRGLLAVIVVVGLLVLGLWMVFGGGRLQTDGEITPSPLDPELVSARGAAQMEVDERAETRILFGDLHVHSTLSVDAFQWSLPLMGGEGVHPPADACDFARFCSQLDFYSLTDHAEALTPRTWEMVRDSVRQCNAVDAASEQPDLVAFTGFEWTQIGVTPEDHYGHRNVIFKETSDEELPSRPIAAPGLASQAFRDLETITANLGIPLRAFPKQQPYNDVGRHVREIASLSLCPDGASSPELPADCRELAETPETLFRKLGEWGFEAMVIPHGTTWGFYTPEGYVYDKQLQAKHDDPRWQQLIEVFSGHGNSEEYRDYRAAERTADGVVCPEPTDEFEPCCWRAGEIVRSRCDDPLSDECDRRVRDARTNFVRLGPSGQLTLPGTDIEEWGNCGQCTDCFQPSYAYRPGGSVQYILSRGSFEGAEKPRHATLGFIASSDNHSARPGTGYKEYERRKMTEARGAIDEKWREIIFGMPDQTDESVPLTREDVMSMRPFQRVWLERQASFFLTGGLVAVHAKERTRDAIWKALFDREVYGTSGDRILLWFDLINAGNARVPMGSELDFDGTPRFRVRAAGAFEQAPGCPEAVEDALGAERLERVCAGECYNPSDRRRRITRIEVVRIGRQMQPSESVGELIEDPWLTLPCPTSGDLCEVEFEDPWFASADREFVYYVRAIQEPSPAVNADGLRCEGDECKPCYGDYRVPFDDDCLAMTEERAWSSPIYLR
ncbi:MAG: DUF3604 domain-containing protein [Deltaproteobacteria bacterium]|jgi:hypothetical protein|nr:DUF3604 domain-containing protein [Deltaproteobacteria bacterium]